MATKLKVLHFMWSANFGGIEKLVIDLCQAQNKTNSVESEILIGCRKGTFMKNLSENKIPHSYADLKSGFDFSPSSYSFVLNKMRNFDVLHIHTFNLLIFKAAVASGKKIIYTIHGNFNFGRKIKWSDRINNLLLRYFLNSKVNFISFNSKFTKETAIKRYHIRHQNHAVIYNGIPLRDPKEVPEISESLPFSENDFIVGTTSRFNGFKRIDRLIEGFALFAKGKQGVKLLLVGDGVVRSELEKKVDECNIRNLTFFAGYQTNVQGYQKLMDVCVFPSQNEPFGLVAIETLSMGKPTLIFSDSGGMIEILENDFPNDIVDGISSLTQRLETYYINKNNSQSQLSIKRMELASRFSSTTMEIAFLSRYSELLAPQ